MSRIGNKPINIPAGVTFTISKSNMVTVKGPKGELSQQVDPDLTVEVLENEVNVKRPTDQKRHKSVHGLYRTLLNNMVQGVSEGYEKGLELIGVGYKADAQGQFLELNLGYSHTIFVALPKEISVETKTEKGKPPKIFLKSIDKQLIGQIAAKIRSLRPPEPYKGKGVRYIGEQIRRKAGKAGAK